MITQSSILAKDANQANVQLETRLDANTHAPVHFCGGSTVTVVTNITRPNANVAFTANAAIGNTTSAIIAFEDVSRKELLSGNILSGKLVKGGSAASATVPSNLKVRLWIYNDTPNTAVVDSNTFSIAFSERTKRIGYIDFSEWSLGSNCAESYAVPFISPLGFTSDANNKLYGVMQTLTAFTPANNEVYEVSLTIIQD